MVACPGRASDSKAGYSVLRVSGVNSDSSDALSFPVDGEVYSAGVPAGHGHFLDDLVA